MPSFACAALMPREASVVSSVALNGAKNAPRVARHGDAREVAHLLVVAEEEERLVLLIGPPTAPPNCCRRSFGLKRTGTKVPSACFVATGSGTGSIAPHLLSRMK